MTPNSGYILGSVAVDGVVSAWTNSSSVTYTFQNVADNHSIQANFEAVCMLQGDGNGDKVVDSADYVLWRSQYGLAVTPGTGADYNKNGMVDIADYLVWRANFGKSC